MGEFTSAMLWSFLSNRFKALCTKEPNPEPTHTELVDIAHEAIENRYQRPCVSMIYCKPDEEELPQFCIKLWTRYGTTRLITVYAWKMEKKKKVIWKRYKRRKKSGQE